jgi:hypothetical protein
MNTMNHTSHTSPRGAYMQRWKTKFGLNMIVMAICFALYYLGLFGGVEGPLTVTNIGRGLAEAGLTSDHFQALLVALFAIALCWNWVVNLLAHATGQRLTCSAGGPEQGFCGAPVERARPAGDAAEWVYTCAHGHRRAEAHFHPVRKGTAANTVLLVSLVCCLMYYFVD